MSVLRASYDRKAVVLPLHGVVEARLDRRDESCYSNLYTRSEMLALCLSLAWKFLKLGFCFNVFQMYTFEELPEEAMYLGSLSHTSILLTSFSWTSWLAQNVLAYG